MLCSCFKVAAIVSTGLETFRATTKGKEVQRSFNYNNYLLSIEFTGRPAGPMIVLNMEYGKDFSGAG